MDIRINETVSGRYVPERAALHRAFIRHYLNRRQPVANPRLIAVTSAPAAGKAGVLEVVKAQLPEHVYINIDEIRLMLPEFPLVIGSDLVRLLHPEAGYIRDLVLEAAMTLKINIILDALLGPAVVRILNYAKKRGYEISLYYIHRPVEEALAAARERPYRTSNASELYKVPDETTRRLHDEARAALGDAARLAGEFSVYDRTATGPGIEQESSPAITSAMTGPQPPVRILPQKPSLASGNASGYGPAPLPPRDPDDEYTAGEFSGLAEPEPDFEEARSVVDEMFADRRFGEP